MSVLIEPVQPFAVHVETCLFSLEVFQRARWLTQAGYKRRQSGPALDHIELEASTKLLQSPAN